MGKEFGFANRELSVVKRLSSPEKIQNYLDYKLTYNKELNGATCRSPRRVLRDRIAHCAEGAYLAAAALRYHGYPPLILDFIAIRDDDHVIAVYKKHGHWGAIGKSNFSGMRFREPVYRTIRELAMSYFAHYYNPQGELTLRAYSRPVNLKKFDHLEWMTTEEDLWAIGNYLCTIKHTPIFSPGLARKRRMLDRRLYEAGMLGAIK
jgi:hypothetical protein